MSKPDLVILFLTLISLFPLIFRVWGAEDYKDKVDYKYIATPLSRGALWMFAWYQMYPSALNLGAIQLAGMLLACTAFHYFFIFFLKAFNIFGMSFGGGNDDKHRRGMTMASATQVARQVKQNGDADAGRFSWGGVPVPRRLEDRSFLLVGSPGSGKSQAIIAALDSIKTTSDRAIITDPSAQFLRRYKRADSLILNPLDSRSVVWSPFAEFDESTYRLDARTIANSLVPEGDGGSSEEWRSFSRSLVRDVMIRAWETDQATNEALNHYACIAGIDELRLLLIGTPSMANLLGEGGEKLLGSVRMTGDKYLDPISLLNPAGGKDSFSVKKWTLDGKGWLFVTYQQNRRAMLEPIIGAILNVVADSMLSRTINKDRAAGSRVWGVFDEFPLLGKISSITNLLSNGSKHGFAGLIGIQTVSQLRNTYGRDTAQTIMACLGSILVLRCNDAETAQYMSQHAGKEEVLRVNQSNSQTDSGSSASQSYQVVNEDVLLASQLQNLPDLQGFLNLAGDYPICPILLALCAPVEDRCEDFVTAKAAPARDVEQEQVEIKAPTNEFADILDR